VEQALVGVGIGLAIALVLALPVAWWLLRRALAMVRRLVMLALGFGLVVALVVAAAGGFLAFR
jgi:hypothetical protein